ncbi:MAG: sigma-54-dependent Fis family transcriptional regulator, partial [Thermodesulfobacteriota bacterium]
MPSDPGTAARVLVVDRDASFFGTFSPVAASQGFTTELALSASEGLDRIGASAYDIVFLREGLPDLHVREAIARIRKTVPGPSVLVLGQEDSTSAIERLLEDGVWDYLLETESPQTILSICKNVVNHRRSLARGAGLPATAAAAGKDDSIIGRSREIQQCLDLVAKAAPSEANVLICGESGTGKELFARAVHNLSNRADRKLVVVDCAALPDNLAESILFGHVKGAFTGADRSQEGLVREADGGTLFLDEIGELPLEIQKKFLRVLQERQVRPIGGKTVIRVDFRLVAATNKDLDALVGRDLFR